MTHSLSEVQKLSIVIGVSLCFFLAEIAVGFYTGSLALIADAFHYLNDLIGFIVALVAMKASQRHNTRPELSFGWQRATLLGAFFNSVFLLALGVSIFLQAIERFVSIEEIQNPRLVMIIGCVGFALNVISVTVLHQHDHDDKPDMEPNATVPTSAGSVLEMTQPHHKHRHVKAGNGLTKQERDFGVLGVLLHVMGDAVNNIGVIIAGAVIWKTTSPARFYADPTIGLAIAMMIFFSALPLLKKSGLILLQSVPNGVNPDDVKHDLEQITGIVAIHELHIWRLNQKKSLASVHIVVDDPSMDVWMTIANTISECLHAYGIHSATLQPERNGILVTSQDNDDLNGNEVRGRQINAKVCMVGCQTNQCIQPSCCD